VQYEARGETPGGTNSYKAQHNTPRRILRKERLINVAVRRARLIRKYNLKKASLYLEAMRLQDSSTREGR